MAKTKLNTDDIIKGFRSNNAELYEQEAVPQDGIDNIDKAADDLNSGENQSIGKTDVLAAKTKHDEMPKEKLFQTSFYITEKQRRALKMKVALGDRPEDKDQSSIVRAALDAYLADILKSQ